jgi:nucleotide-binding universal stress UspA family protein
VLRRVHAAPEESQRLVREELLGQALIAGATSALLPTRGGLNSEVAAGVLDALLQPSASVTVLTVRERSAPGGDPFAELNGVFAALRGREVERRAVVGDDPAARILEEAALGHRVLTLGLNDDFVGSHQLSEPVQRVIAGSPVPLLLVRRGEHLRDSADMLGAPFRRVLLGVTGTRPGLAAEEVAFRLTGRYAARLLAVHVVTRGGDDAGLTPAVQRQIARVRESAGAFGTSGVFQARRAPMAADELLRSADEWQADTIVVGATVRPIDGRPFLGHGTEWLFEHARQVGKLMQGAIEFNIGYSCSGQRRKQYSAQGIAKGCAVSSFQRFNNKPTVIVLIIFFHKFYSRFFYFYHDYSALPSSFDLLRVNYSLNGNKAQL